jgi:hypothetical protein
MRMTLLSLGLMVFLVACGGTAPSTPQSGELPERGGRATEVSFAVSGGAPDRTEPPAEQKIIRTAALSVEVEDLDAAERETRSAVEELGGRIESASRTGEESMRFRIRVPAGGLDRMLGATAALGRVLSRQIGESDVTTRYIDVEARLKTRLALRDRLQALLAEAKSVEDVLNIERELARVQGEIDAMQGQLDYLDRQVAESTIDLTLQVPEVTPPEQKPGPLGYVFVGLWKAVKWLFVWEQ